MSVLVFAPAQNANQPGNRHYAWMSLDVNDVFTYILGSGTATITGITIDATTATDTSIAYTATGAMPASPKTLTAFQALLSTGTLVRTGYRGTVNAQPDAYAASSDAAGNTVGEKKLRK